MGSFIEVNDTLQLTRTQGFPPKLDLKKHQKKPFRASDFKSKIFQFKNKDGLRIFHSPPVRVFFAQNIKDKWIYWGLVHILELNWNCVKRVTSGKFKIIHIFPPDKMEEMYNLTDRRPEKNYFNQK